MIILFYVGLMLIVGLLFGKLAKLLRLPNVTGYLIGGLVVGPVFNLAGIHLLSEITTSQLATISQIALGFIAFTIGTDFRLSYFKRVGASPLIIATFESFGAIVAVLAVLLAIGTDLKFALVLSSIAAATAPAATLMIIKQYKAKGDVTENLMSVVAIDDATAIIFFGIFVAIANAVGNADVSLGMMILKPFLEILISLSFGFIWGLLLSIALKWYTGRSNRISVIVAFIFIAISFQYLVKIVLPTYDVSTLLACMMMGAVFTNTTADEETNKIMELVDRFTPPILIFFFVVSGADLNLHVLSTVGIMGVIYIVMRVVGKVLGAYFGAVISKSDHKVRKYLGWGLVPQAGVAIGLTVVASSLLPAEQAAVIRAVVLSATLIYELIGPFITKMTLIKAGDIVIVK